MKERSQISQKARPSSHKSASHSPTGIELYFKETSFPRERDGSSNSNSNSNSSQQRKDAKSPVPSSSTKKVGSSSRQSDTPNSSHKISNKSSAATADNNNNSSSSSSSSKGRSLNKPIDSPSSAMKKPSSTHSSGGSGKKMSSKKSAVKRKTISSPAATSSSGGSGSGSKSKVAFSNKQSPASKKAAALRQRAIAEFEAVERSQKAEMEKLRKQRMNQRQRLDRLLLLEQQQRFPMREELIPRYDSTGPQMKPLPVALLHLDALLPAAAVTDALQVWDFVNNFNKQLGINRINLEDFAELLQHKSSGSVALTDLFCSLLNLLLSDHHLLAKINASLPHQLQFTYFKLKRSTSAVAAASNDDANAAVATDAATAVIRSSVGVDSAPATDDAVFDVNDLLQQEDFDCEYNGHRLLNRRLKQDSFNALQWQSVLRCIVLRLDPVKRLRRAVLDVTDAMYYTYTTTTNNNNNNNDNSNNNNSNSSNNNNNNNSSNNNTTNNSDSSNNSSNSNNNNSSNGEEVGHVPVQQLDALLLLSSAFKRTKLRAPQQQQQSPVATYHSNNSNSNSSNTVSNAAAIVCESPFKVLPASSMKVINTPKALKASASSSNNNSSSNGNSNIAGAGAGAVVAGQKVGSSLDKDAIFQLTCDVTTALQNIYSAAEALEKYELYELHCEQKLSLLRVLVTACYDTERVRQLMQQHAEERAVQLQNASKQLRELKAKQRESNQRKKSDAVAACRLINKKAAEAAAAKQKAKDAKKGAAAAGSKQNKSSSSSGGSSSARDKYDPSPEQLNAMIEELIVLEAAGVDAVQELPTTTTTAVTDDDGEEEDSNSDDNSDNGSDSWQYDNRGNLIPKSSKSRRLTAQARAKANEKKRALLLQQQEQQQQQLAEQRLRGVISAAAAASERDLRAAVRVAERSGLKWTQQQSGHTLCTPLLRDAYKMLSELEAKAKEEKLSSSHEKSLQEHFIRTAPIGTDRFQREYWSFPGDDRLFVCSRVPLPQPLPQQQQQLLAPHNNSNNNDSVEEQYNHPLQQQQQQQWLLAPPSTGAQSDALLAKLFSSRPNRFRYEWSVYCGYTEQWLLWDALDDRGEHEKPLKAKLKALFELDEPGSDMQTDGSQFIGRRVIRTQKDNKPIIGVIKGWFPPFHHQQQQQQQQQVGDKEREGGKQAVRIKKKEAVWHALHTDGEEEDIAASDLPLYLLPLQFPDATTATAAAVDAIVDAEFAFDQFTQQTQRHHRLEAALLATAPASTATATAVVIAGESSPTPDSSNGSAPGSAAATVSSGQKRKRAADSEATAAATAAAEADAATAAATAAALESDSTAGLYEEYKKYKQQRAEAAFSVPRIVSLSNGLTRLPPHWRSGALQLSPPMGLPALQQQLLRQLQLMNDALKRRGGDCYSRDWRRTWECQLKSCQSLAQLRNSLLQLEEVAYSAQQAPDHLEDAQLERSKAQTHRRMLQEGWLFNDGCHALVGRLARRFFRGHGLSDGRIVAFLPAQQNEGLALLHMEHSDGDREDLEESDAEHALRAYEEDWKEDAVAAAAGGEEEEEDGDNDDDSSFEEDEDDDDESLDAADGEGDNDGGEDELQLRLWPTREVRSRWQDALNAAQTVAEVALALQRFVEFARTFRIMDEDPFEVDRKEKIVAAQRSRSRSSRSASSSAGTRSSARNSSSNNNSSSGKRTAGRRSSDNNIFSAFACRPRRTAAQAVVSYAE